MEKEVMRWPAQESSIFRDDESLFGRRPSMPRLEDFFGKRMLWYGCMAASKTGQVLAELDVLHYFQPAGFDIQFFLPKILSTVTSEATSRRGQKFKGEVKFVDTAEEIYRHAGDRVRRSVIAIGEVGMLDSAIIEVSQELARAGNSVLMEGLDLSFRGEYFPFKDFENGRTMEDLIRSVPRAYRFPVHAFCTSPIDGNDDNRCRIRARFTQRFLPNGQPAPWYDPLLKFRDYTETTGVKKDQAPDKYRAMCAEHLQVPGSHVPRIIDSIVRAKPGSSLTHIERPLDAIGVEKDVVKSTMARMLDEKKIIQRNHAYHPAPRYVA